MMIEDDYYANAGSASSTWSVTRYGLGARGIDYIAKEDHNGPAGESFPIYDGHGNMVATLSRSGSNNYALANFRSYDVWGSVRQQNSVDSDGGPKQKYCANLGHVQDDESDLIYMRARYYEPSVGRFLSEDPAMDHANWFIYCRNKPTMLADPTGKAPWNNFENAITFLALIRFLEIASRVSDASELESAYADFWKKASYSFLEDTLGLPDMLGTLLDAASAYHTFAHSMAMSVAVQMLIRGEPRVTAFAYLLASVRSAADTGLGKFAMQMLAYGSRMLWYLGDM